MRGHLANGVPSLRIHPVVKSVVEFVGKWGETWGNWGKG